MTRVNLDPNGTTANTGAVTGSSAHAALSDGSDSTFVDYDAYEASILTLSDLSLPSGALLLAAQVMVRCRKDGTGPGSVTTVLGADTTKESTGSVTWGSAATLDGVTIFDGTLTDAGLDGASIGIVCKSLSVVRAYKAWVQVLYYTKPTVTVTAPTGTVSSNIVRVYWTPAFDADADSSAYSYEVKVFSSAQYSAGGFDPSTSSATLSGSGSDGAGNLAFSSVLADGGYRAYVRVAAKNTPSHWSDWDYEQFTVDAPSPGVPVVSVAGENSRGCVRIGFVAGSGDSSTDWFEIERSVDYVNWVSVRTDVGGGRVPSGRKMVFDYDAPNGGLCWWRVRAGNDQYGTVSDWSVVQGSWESSDWWLKHSLFSALNTRLLLRSYPGWQDQANQGVFRPLGSSEPVVVSDVRGPLTGQIEVFTEGQDERDELAATLALQAPMLLQGPVAADIPERWVVFGDASSQRVVDTQDQHFHTEVLPFTEVAAPSRDGFGWSYPDLVCALDCALLLPLSATNGLVDRSGNGYDGTAVGGLTVGGASPGPLVLGDEGATLFDGTDDRVTTTYATRRNYIRNPSFEVDANNYSQGGASRTNIVPNPSLETGITGWAAIVGSSVWSTDAFMFGSNAFKSVSTGANNRVYSGPAGDATAGTTYTASGYGRTEESGRTGKVMIRFFDSGGNTLQSTDGTTSSYTASTWQRFSVTATAPPGTAKVGMALYWDAGGTASSGQVCYADGFLIETGSSLLTYFPSGSQLANLNLDITWAGTAHASASTWAMKVTRTSAQAVTGSYSGYVTTNGQTFNGISAASSGAPLPAGKTWTASCYVKADTSAIGQTLRLTVAERDSGSTVGTSFTEIVLTGSWQRVWVTRTFTTGTDFWAYATLSGAPAAFWVDGYMFEQGSSAGSLFPTPTQLASGEAGWTGTAHSSYSDIGCFANGTSRTFMGWAKTSSTDEKTLIGGAGGGSDPVPYLVVHAGNNVVFNPDVVGGSSTTWSGALTGRAGVWTHWALVFDEVANTAELFIDGVSVGLKTGVTSQFAATPNFQIGAYRNGWGPFNGQLAWMSVHGRALTAGEIRQAYETGL